MPLETSDLNTFGTFEKRLGTSLEEPQHRLMSEKYEEVGVPENVTFPVRKLLVPESTNVIIIRDSSSTGNPAQRSGRPEQVHVLSDEAHNVTQIHLHDLDGSLRKRIWRSIPENRRRENAQKRKMYTVSCRIETFEERNSPLLKRRAYYAARKLRRNETNSEDFSASSSEISTLCDDYSSYSPPPPNSNASEQSTSDSHESESTPVQSRSNSSSFSNSSRCLSSDDVHKIASSKAQDTFIYEVHVETKVVKIYNHLLAPVDDFPKNGIVLDINRSGGAPTACV
ncbi:hypothetical protein FGB62_407g03 [Gracilaria domingensis]|nr:hypothetical protein FGB62_407g03 [Gracilaria domingensis]